LSFLLFPVEQPHLFDAVILGSDDRVREIQVKQPEPASNWIWGAFKMPATVFHALAGLWRERREQDEYIGTLINAYLARGGTAYGVKAGDAYVDVGTLNGYRGALNLIERMHAAEANAADRKGEAVTSERQAVRP
jgi:NDP-sugar pyrophosphorylase family protein